MTSINGIRFDEWSGAMVCDEQRHWNPDRMKMFAADKIKPVVPPEIAARYGFAAAYGNTGTSTIGEELRAVIRSRVAREYKEAVERLGEPPAEFLSMEDLAGMVFEEQRLLKERHVDEQLQGRYGFRTRDLCRQSYAKEGAQVEINAKEVLEAAENLATFKEKKGDSRAVFGNAGIVGGYSPKDGFRLFQFSMTDGTWNPVEAVFVAHGSGSDAANIRFAEYAAHRIPELSDTVDPVDGVTAAIAAVNAAARTNLGVGGYFNILLFDGRAEKAEVLREIQDHRSKLASEIVRAEEEGWVPEKTAREMIGDLLFREEPFEAVLRRFHAAGKSRARLSRLLRGYREGEFA
jgi:hypothetical protein